MKRCISVGPFRDVSEAAHAASTLRGGGYDPRQRVADGEVWAGVWVYLPLPAARAVADQTLAKLKAGGIDDALEMPGPNEGSVISLGLYSEPKRAQARVAQAQALGFNPGIADRKRTGNVYWIDIDLKPTDSLLNPSDLQGESGRIVRLEVKGCPVGGPDMSARTAVLRVTSVIGAIIGYGCLAAFLYLIGMQLHGWFRQGEWTHIGMGDGIKVGLMRCCVRDDGAGHFAGFLQWWDSPVNWLGLAQSIRGDPGVSGVVRREHRGQQPVHLLPRSRAAQWLGTVKLSGCSALQGRELEPLKLTVPESRSLGALC